MTIFDFDGDGDFGIDDAATLGGIMGFAEESMREEETRLEEDSFDDIEIDPRTIKDINLRLFYNGNPALFKHVVNTVRKHVAASRKRSQMRSDLREVQHELDAMRDTELLMNEEDL
jgi:hypothetical protein